MDAVTMALEHDRDRDDTTTATGTSLSPALSAGEAENIAVCIRVRPLNEREVRSRDANVLRTISAMNMISITDVDGAPLSGKHNVFQYDHIYDETRSTRHMYAQVAKRIVRSTLEGINGTIFAYGQTSSGKTYTMQGNGEMPSFDSEPNTGILQLAVEDIFTYIESCDDRDFLLRVSFVEIYNEVVKDLLTLSDKGNNLKLREDPRKGVYVECKEEIITNYEDILNLLAQGNLRRTVGQTAMNERSSRSHSIFRIVIESKQKSTSRRQSEDDVTGAVLVACLSLVDLAGSESVRHTAAEGIRQREAGNINKSLLTLSRVINSLASASSGGQNAPFRDSKLTRLLQNSLDGNTRTLIICCVTPSDRFLDETKSTLQFAARAKDIQTSASVNEVLDDQAQLKRLKREVHELKKLVNNEALNALKAENEALMHEKSRHKEEYARLMGLILTSTTRTKPSSDSKVKPRAKRTRETWCPGDFPALPLRDLENTRSAGGALSPNPQPRKRRSGSGAKENVVPQNLLSALEEEMDDDENDGCGDGIDGVQRTGSSRKAHVLSARLLNVFELALENYRGDNDENYRELNAAIEEAHDLVTREEDQERLSELLQDLKSLVDMSASSQHLRGENEVLNMEVEELHRKLNLLENPSLNSQEDREEEQVDQGLREPLEELKLELSQTQESLKREREQVTELTQEKQIVEQMAAEEAKVLAEQVEALRVEIDEKEAVLGAEKQSFEAALAKKTEELAQLQSELSRQLEEAFTEIKKQKQLRTEDVERLEKELGSRNAELEAEAAAFKKLQATIQQQSSEDDERASLRSERDALESMLREMEEARDALQSRVKELEEAGSSDDRAQLGGDTEAAESLEAQNQLLITERATLTEGMMALEEQLQQTATYHSDLDARVKFLVEEKSALTDASQQEQEAMESESNDGDEGLSGELQRLLQDLSKLQFELEQVKGEKRALATEAEQAKRDLASVKTATDEELERLRTELEYAANEKQASDVNIQDLNEERAQLAEAIRSIKFEMEHLLGENNRKTDRLELELIDLRVVKEKRESEVAALRAKLDTAGEEMMRLKKKLVEFDDDKQALLATVASLETLEAKLQELLGERESHSLQVSGLESRLEAQTRENARLTESVQVLSSEKLTWLQQSASDEDLVNEIGAMQQEQSRLSLLVEELETRLASMSDENQQNLDQVTKLAAEIVEYEATVAEQSSAIEQLRAELALNDEEHAALQNRIDELSSLEEQLGELEHENSLLKDQHAQLSNAHTSQIYELEEAKIQVEVQLSDLVNENAKLLEQLRNGQVLTSEQQGHESSATGDQTQLHELLNTLESEKQKLGAELEQVLSQKSELLDELSALESQLMEESQEKMRLTTAFEELETKLRDLKRRSSTGSDDGSGDASDLQSELQLAREAEFALANELERVAAMMEQLEAENKSLKQRSSRTSSSVDDDVDELRQRLEIEGELRTTLELDVKSYEETLHVLRNELKDSSDTITDLLEKLKVMEVDMEQLVQVKEKAEREMEIARELTQRAKEEQSELRFQNQQRVLSSEQKDRSLYGTVEQLEQQLKDAKLTIQRQQDALDGHQSSQRPESSEDVANSSEMLKKTVADLQDELIEARKALAVQEDAWKAKQSGAEKQFALLASELERQASELSRLNQAIADTHSNEQELSSELTSVKRAYTELLQRKEELEKQLQELDAQWRAREDKLGAKVSSELLSVKKAYSEVAAEKERIEQQLSENDAQWRAKEQALGQQAAAEMDSLREQYQEAQEELDSYQKYADDEIHKLRASIESNDLEMHELTRASKAKESELSGRLQEQEQWVAHLKTKHQELEAEVSELYGERKTLESKIENLLTSRDDAVDQLQSELQDMAIKYEQAEANFSEASEDVKGIKSNMEKLEGEAYQLRNELEDMSEALKSAQMEAMHYHKQLVEVQAGKEELDKLVETQKKRIDKLEKVKMTTETLDLFRKLKKDREELQVKVQTLQQELLDAEKSSANAKEASKQQTTRVVQRKEEELGMMREHIAELEQAVQSEKERANLMKSELKTTIRDVMDKSQQETRDMQDVLRERAAQMDSLEQQVKTLEQEKAEILEQKSGNVTYLEKENLELLVENRQLKKRLERSSSNNNCSSRLTGATTTTTLEDLPDIDESATAASAVLMADSKSSRAPDFGESKSSGSGGLSGFLIPSKDATAAAAKDEAVEEEEARPACAQQ
ncbi:Kinesin-like protein [Globisporangium polare]